MGILLVHADYIILYLYRLYRIPQFYIEIMLNMKSVNATK